MIGRLASPEVYRKETHASSEGYYIGREPLLKILETARGSGYFYIFFQNFSSHCGIGGDFERGVHIVFSKEDREAEVKASWQKVLGPHSIKDLLHQNS